MAFGYLFAKLELYRFERKGNSSIIDNITTHVVNHKLPYTVITTTKKP
jgi:hypothetical protein